MEWYFWLLLAILYVIIGVFVTIFDFILLSLAQDEPIDEDLVSWTGFFFIFIWPYSLIVSICFYFWTVLSKKLAKFKFSYKIRVNGWKIKFYK